mgnify:CR=1 FL=1
MKLLFASDLHGSAYYAEKLEELNAHLTENFYEEGSLHTPGNITLSVLEKPKLRQRPSASVVVAVVSVSLLAIIVIVFLISYQPRCSNTPSDVPGVIGARTLKIACAARKPSPPVFHA